MKLNLTNEEAIEQLRLINAFIGYDKDSYVVKRMQAALDMAIKALEQTSWIPVSERLPEKDGFYLATCDGEICGEDEPFSGLAEFENGKWTDDEEGYQCVLAWQPLPQPYKAESEDEE